MLEEHKCLIYRRSVGEHYYLVTFELAVKQLKRIDNIFSRYIYIWNANNVHVDCKHQLGMRVYK